MVLDPLQSIVNSIYIYKDNLIVGMGDYQCKIYDLNNLKLKKIVDNDLWEVRCVAMNDDYLFVGSLNEQIIVFDTVNYDKITSITHELGINSIYLDDLFLYSSSFNQSVRIWDNHTLEFIGELKNHHSRANKIISDNEYIYTSDGFTTNGASIRIWDKVDFKLLDKKAEPPSKRILSLFYDSNFIYSGHGSPNELRIWNKNNLELIHQITDLTGGIVDIIVTDKYILALGHSKLYKWDKNDYKLIDQIDEKGKETNSMSVYNNLLIMGSRNNIKIFDLDSFKLVNTIS